jgi:hypothetical protein
MSDDVKARLNDFAIRRTVPYKDLPALLDDTLTLINAQAERIKRQDAALKHYTDRSDPYEPANKQQLDDMAAHVNEVHASNRILRIELADKDAEIARLRMDVMTRLQGYAPV